MMIQADGKHIYFSPLPHCTDISQILNRLVELENKVSLS